jgi:hypothetical protein
MMFEQCEVLIFTTGSFLTLAVLLSQGICHYIERFVIVIGDRKYRRWDF